MPTVGYRLLALITVPFLWASSAVAQSKPLAPAKPRPLPGLQTGAAPWTGGLDGLSERLEAIGLPAMPSEAFVQHIHQHLTITIRGATTTVPAMIGINQLARYISPIHTHDTTGTVHIEAATKDGFTLGQFFDVWGVRFTAQCIGGYCAKGGDVLK
ncbi:MAG: hypothetical protein HY700_14165, partial [Gemmatimonadetes bacterium]|nr:hypothetical protein [Gemmatimonadota bacterium]